MSHIFQVKKISDEGSASPFMVRLFMGLLELRDQLYLLGTENKVQEQLRSQFDSQFDPMFVAAQATRDAALETRNRIAMHMAAIEAGRVIQFRGNQYDVQETIDTPLSQAVDKLIDQGIVAIKTGLQEILGNPLGLSIGFVFQKPAQFAKGISDLQQSGQNDLARYLQVVRQTWLSDFQELRTQHEHHGWTLGTVEYHLIGPSQVDVGLPTVLGLPVNEFAPLAANRVLLFIENMMVYAMQRKCQHPIFVVEIPKAQRDPVNLRKFRLAPRGLDPAPPWVIAYTEEMDFV